MNSILPILFYSLIYKERKRKKSFESVAIFYVGEKGKEGHPIINVINKSNLLAMELVVLVGLSPMVYVLMEYILPVVHRYEYS